MTLRRPSTGTVLGGLALFVALGGPAEAARTIGLTKNAVKSTHIRNGTVTIADLSKRSVRTLRATPANSIRGTHVADGSLGGSDLAVNAIGGDRIADGSLGGADLAANSIAGDRIADGSLSGGDLADNTVGSNDIALDAVDGGEIRDGAVGSADIADGRLRGADVGRFVGRMTLVFGNILQGQCKTVATSSLTPVSGATQDINDDAIVVTPGAGFPDGSTVLAKPAGTNQIAVSVCNHTMSDRNYGSQSFEFVTYDTAGE